MAIPAKPTITAPPNDLPTRGENETNFSNKINNLVAWYPSLTDNLNNSIDWMDTVFTAVEGEVALAQQAVTDAGAQVVLAQQAVTDAEAQVTEAEAIKDNVAALANFIGPWADQTGSASIPTSVLHDGQYWQLLVPLADITSVEPGTDVGTWFPIVETNLDIGSITYSFDDLTSSGLFVETGMSYLQSAYPELFDIIGIGEAPPTTKITDVTDEPNTSPRSVALSNNADYVAVTGASTVLPETILRVYSRSGDDLTQLDDPDVNPTGGAFGCAINGAGDLILVGLIGSPYLELYTRSGTAITKGTAPSTGIIGASTTVGSIDFNYDSAFVAFISSDNAVDNLFIYSVSGTTLVETDAFDAGGSSNIGLKFHPSSNYLALISGTSGTAIRLYSMSGGGVLTLEQTITSTTANNSFSVNWSNDGNYLIVGCEDGIVRVFSFSSGTLTEITQTFGTATGASDVNGVGFSLNNDYVLLSLQGSPYLEARGIVDGVIGDAIAPSTAPSNGGGKIATATGVDQYFVLNNAAPKLWQYKSDFPFNINTEFYVPDVDPLSPTQIGDWLPGVTGTAYVRAK